MLEKLRQHFSFTTPASVYDEEALTALELSGRYGKKINELIDDQNAHRSEIKKEVADQSTRIENYKKEQDGKIAQALKTVVDTLNKEVGELPSELTNAILNYINNGTFDEAIDTYAGGLIAQLNNLLGKVTEGSTSMDAEVIDGRVDYAGQSYPNIGDAIRVVTEAIYKRHRNWVVGAYGYSAFNIKTASKTIEFSLNGDINSTYALFTASGFHRMESKSYNYTDVWGDRTSGGTFALMYERLALGGKLVLKEIPENFPSELTGDKPIIAVILFKNDGSVVHVCCCDDFKNILQVDGKKWVSDVEHPPCKYKYNEPDKTMMIFNNILCVGDSLTAGHIEGVDGEQYPSNPLQSYPYYLSRLLGMNYGGETGANADLISLIYNVSRSGFAVSDTFIDADVDDANRWCEIDMNLGTYTGLIDCIILGVGVNDYNKTPIGTNADTVESPTFYGGYKYLVQILREYHPNAHIFCLTSPDFELFSPYTNAIKNIVESSDDRVHFIDLSSIAHRGAFQSELITSSKVGNHFTAVGYQQIARNIMQFISEYINENISKFLDFRGA